MACGAVIVSSASNCFLKEMANVREAVPVSEKQQGYIAAASTTYPSPTSSFLTPASEEGMEEEHFFFVKQREQLKSFRRVFHKSQSFDMPPTKPHPLRSPIMFLKNSTVARLPRQNGDAMQASRVPLLAISPEGQEWHVEDENSALLRIDLPGTSDDTPFSKVSTQPYYASGAFSAYTQSLYSPPKDLLSDCVEPSYPTMKILKRNGSPDAHRLLRRRASSLDCIPDLSHLQSAGTAGVKSLSPVAANDGSPFSRSSSLSQRSPFRRKIAFADPEESMAGLKEGRPKSMKQFKTGRTALFSAIERQNLPEVRRLLEMSDININELNRDHFTPLDITLMTGGLEFAKLLLNRGAVESAEFSDPATRARHLESLIADADKNVNDLTATIVNCVGDVKESEKKLRDWEWRLYMLRIMQNGFLSADRPSEKPAISVASLSNTSLMVMVSPHPQEVDGKDMVTKYKVEWSKLADFSVLEGCKIITDRRQQFCTITGLDKNVPCYIRAQCGNLKGFGVYGFPDPVAVVPSSWRECGESLPRYYAASERFNELLDELHVLQNRSFEKIDGDSSSEEEIVSSSNQTSAKPRKKMMKSLSKYKHFIFNSAPKLLKKIKSRGIFLAALLYSEDATRVMVTMDENLPIVEVDDNYSKSFSQEFYWLFKASCTWEDIEHMLYLSNKAISSPSVLIRRKLLHAALALQSATGITNLGPLHFQPFKDSNGSILLLAVNCVKKSASQARSTSMKWLSIHKIVKRCISATTELAMVPEKLIPSVQQQVNVHKRSKTCLPRGLYVGYLKLRTSVDTLSVVVQNSHPSVLPFVKVRDVPNVTKEEWLFLNDLRAGIITKEMPLSLTLSAFLEKLKSAIGKLLFQVGPAEETFLRHGLFLHEVVELNSDVLFLLVIPPREDLCTLPGQTDHLSASNFFSAVPVQAFEMLSMMTYQPDLIAAYSRLSSSIELDVLSTQQCSREALSPTDAQRLRERLGRLSDIQHGVDDCWKRSRWLVQSIHVCKDRSSKSTLALSAFFDPLDFRASLGSGDHAYLRHSDESSFTSDVEEGAARLVTVHGAPELGVPVDSCAEVFITAHSSTEEVIRMVASQFASLAVERHTVEDESVDDSCLAPERWNQLGLVLVVGNDERWLRDDLALLEQQNLLEKGTLHLRRKEVALLANSSNSSEV